MLLEIKSFFRLPFSHLFLCLSLLLRGCPNTLSNTEFFVWGLCVKVRGSRVVQPILWMVARSKSGVQLPVGARFLSLPPRSEQLLGAASLASNGTGSSAPTQRIKGPEHEANFWLTSVDEFWLCGTLSTLHSVVLKHRDQLLSSSCRCCEFY